MLDLVQHRLGSKGGHALMTMTSTLKMIGRLCEKQQFARKFAAHPVPPEDWSRTNGVAKVPKMANICFLLARRS
jgi:hypothetical protein